MLSRISDVALQLCDAEEGHLASRKPSLPTACYKYLCWEMAWQPQRCPV